MSESYDILIQNATIVDGSGQPAYRGNVGIRGEKIAAVGETGDAAARGTAARVIDGRGLIACPGFIDPHSHANRGVVDTPTADNLVMQGIRYVLVNGQIVCEDGAHTGARPGKVLRHR
jgi:N-acyl-D-amino-acid deacylase